MVILDTENQQYNQKIYKQSEKIEQITRLDDMKKIKQALKQELENLQQTVRDKQNRDCKKLKSLSKKVTTLNHELKRAKVDSLMDGLTGIYNRKAFDRYLQELIPRDAFTHVSFALLMMDIDNFKDNNPLASVTIGKGIRLKPLPIEQIKRSTWLNASEKTGSHLKMK